MKTKVKKLNFYKEPEEAFYPYRNEKYAVFLDSSMKNEQGRYSVIALEPYLILEEENGVCKINEDISGDPVEKVLDPGHLGICLTTSEGNLRRSRPDMQRL